MAKDDGTAIVATQSSSNFLYSAIWWSVCLYQIFVHLKNAYKIRLMAIEEYGLVIHEFDPYFNFRATEYLYEHGASKFFEWFDYMVWYPLGRPVGTTIYPGMQFVAVWIKQFLLGSMSLNDICCYMPAWFGCVATFVVGLIAYECALPHNSALAPWTLAYDFYKGVPTNTNEIASNSRAKFLGLCTPALEAAVFAMFFMAIVPAHLMRSIGGGYDNESVAVSAMVITFYCWIRSLRHESSAAFLGILTGVAYFGMVAAWGGYVFVLNMIGIHAGLLVLMGRFSTKIYLSYSFFYVVGTALAIHVPVVGWAPIKSLEQLGPAAVFCGYQLLFLCQVIAKKRGLNRTDTWKLRIQVSAMVAVIGLVLIWFVTPTGYFGPFSARVRGLFIKHTKTGNPLVDSVAEHQATSRRAYFQYLHQLCAAAPLGFIVTIFGFGDGSSFLLAWGAAAYFFSGKMVRLVLLTAPVAAALGGLSIGRLFAWCLRQLWGDEGAGAVPVATPVTTSDTSNNKPGKEGKKKKKKAQQQNNNSGGSDSFKGIKALRDGIKTAVESKEGLIVRRTLAVLCIGIIFFAGSSFSTYCWKIAGDLSQPTIIIKGRLRNGTTVRVDDYREAYWWLRDNTPADARIMAWWDYGYQITAIANRTTMADGNTWNHEHIALLGRALTSAEEDGHEIARHMADYVLIWGGGGGDDLAKSPHLARIANSVYRDMCPGDPTCRMFGFVDQRGTPSAMMERSLLYRLHGHKLKKNVQADPSLFREVYRSKYGRVRIFKILNVSEESKSWVNNPANRDCDVEGGWYCRGLYPPALQKVLSQKRDFAQLEDFNKRSGSNVGDEDYQKQYYEALKNPELARARARAREKELQQQQQQSSISSKPDASSEDGDVSSSSSAATTPEAPTKQEKEDFYNRWENTEETTLMWQLITQNNIAELKGWLQREPLMAFMRSEDGRGPMWWAFEQRNQEVMQIFMNHGVSLTDRDKYGKTPQDLLTTN